MNCPLCGFTKTHQLFAPGPSKEWLVESCAKCTNAWTIPSPENISYEYDNFHEQFSIHSINQLPLQWRKSLLMQIELLSHSLKSGARILEVGCGEGLFLSALAQRGFQVMGIEPSKSAGNVSRRRGIDVATGYFPHTEIDGPFDAVIMSHVLEHISNPTHALQEVSKLVPGGKVLLVQTNWQGLIPRIQKRQWYAWVPEQHFWHFTPRGLSSILERSLGWHVREIQYSSLEHGSSRISRISELVSVLCDQFHLLADVPSKILE
jgi:SAM-dependent methyltransferase